MSKPIAVFDIDGTIFRSSLLIELTNSLIDRRIFRPEHASAYSREYESWLNRTGSYQDYLDKLIEAFAKKIIGLPQEAVKTASAEVVERLGQRTYRYTRGLIEGLAKTHTVVAISGSPLEMVELFANRYGFDDYSATVYEAKNGIYTGKHQAGHVSKDKIVHQMVEKHYSTLTGSVGVGDTESDIKFLELVERPIAFNPNSVLFTHAVGEGWQIVVERKDVVYYYNHERDAIRTPDR
jgi:HAD superfamily hydrolase (TIGR01490 family)